MRLSESLEAHARGLLLNRIRIALQFARPKKRRQRLVIRELLGCAIALPSGVTDAAAVWVAPINLAFSRARGFGPLLSAQMKAYEASTFLVIRVCRSVILTD